MSTPLVSVIIPAHNAAEYLHQTLESVFWQNWPALQVIVVDDGSTDATPELLERWQARYPAQLEVYRQRFGGPAPVRNYGIQQARGKYLAFLDADDIWWPGKLAAQINFLEQHDGDAIVYGKFVPWHANANGEFELPVELSQTEYDASIDDNKSGWVYHQLLLDVATHTCALAGPTELFVRHGGFREDLPIGEDYDLWLRLSQEVPFYAQRGFAVLYRQHEASTTRQLRARNFEYERVTEALQRWGRRSPDGSEAHKRAIKQRLASMSFGHGYGHCKWF